jgi:hypothetical protein
MKTCNKDTDPIDFQANRLIKAFTTKEGVVEWEQLINYLTNLTASYHYEYQTAIINQYPKETGMENGASTFKILLDNNKLLLEKIKQLHGSHKGTNNK